MLPFWHLEWNIYDTYVRTFFDFSLLGSWGGFEVGTGLHFGWWNRICESSTSSRTRGNTARIKKHLHSYIFYVSSSSMFSLSFPLGHIFSFYLTSLAPFTFLSYLPSFFSLHLTWYFSFSTHFCSSLLSCFPSLYPPYDPTYLFFYLPTNRLSYFWPFLLTWSLYQPHRSIKSLHVFLFSSQLGWISIWR